MLHRVARVVCFFSLLAFAAGLVRGAENVILPPALTAVDVDLGRSAIYIKDQRTPLTAGLFYSYFYPVTDQPVRNEIRATANWRAVLVFKKPQALGSAFLGICGGSAGDFQAQALRPDFTGAIDGAKPTDWQAIAATAAFPADFKTQAVQLKCVRDYRGPLSWLFFRPQLTNVTATAVGSGERAPFGAHPDAIPRGEVWFNTGKDSRPGAPKQMQRGPVSEALPSWYILSWDAPQSLSGLWLSCNADKFRVFAYRGEEGLNPAVAPESAWKVVDTQVVHQQAGGGERPIDRLLAFPALKTVAIKLEMTSCQRGPVAVIGQMAALAAESRSADAELAGHQEKKSGTKSITFEQPFDGQLALVITDEAGRNIRNLVAQVDRRKGPNTESWDLKDDAGLAVTPGKYRWKAITSPPLGLRYQMTIYPNAPQIFPGMAPWLTGEAGANGWLADHASITSGAACGDRLYFGSPGVEGGVSLIECNLQGRKQWGKHSFGPFSGVGRLTADQRYVYIQERDSLHRLDPRTHQIERLTALSSVERQGTVVGFAAHEGRVAISLTAPVPWLENATRAEVIDLEHSIPKFAERIPDPLGTRRVQPNPRFDFLRLLRLTGQPAGQGQVAPDRRESIFPISIDSAGGSGKYQYVVIAFREPTPLGSVVLPCVGPEFQVEMSVLNADAKYPPDPRQESDWTLCPEQPKPGWTCIPMPAQTRTRALRLRVRLAKDAAEDNLIDDLIAKDTPKDPTEIDLDRPQTGDAKPAAKANAATAWFARFEGLKLLRRRFTNVTPTATVRVSSGEVDPLGVWDAQRTEALSTEDPGVYVLEWNKPQSLAGLAIKEIDGALTEIDVWEDAAGTNTDTVPLTNSPGWRRVASYEQARRDSYEPAFERNDCALYMDGYVAFGKEISTRAVRLRVVSQWADNTQRGTASQRRDLGGRTLDPRRCRIWGVAALQYLGKEAPVDTLSSERLEVRDGQTGKLISETLVKLAEGGPSKGKTLNADSNTLISLAYRADGALFGILQGQVVQIDVESGAAKLALVGFDGQTKTAHRLAISTDGLTYVAVLPENQVEVYDPQGKLLRTIGHAGGQQFGPWDPEKFNQIETLVVDSSGQLWVVESQDVPRRIVQYDAKGTFVREFYGNTHYGGGGVLDPADKSRLIYHHIEFAIDWKTGKSRIKNKLAPWMPEDCVPVRYQGHTYLTTTPLSHQATQHVGIVYRYDEQPGTATLAAAFGEANAFEQLKTPAILRMLAMGKVPQDYTFLWADLNGDGEVNPDEVKFELKPSAGQNLALGRFTSALHCWAGSQMYQPKSVLKNGVPVFEKIQSTPGRAGVYEFQNGDVLALSAQSERRVRHGDGLGQETRSIDKAGRTRWTYPTEHYSVSGLWLPPYEPGYVSNEFAVIGHATARAGDLGEYVVVHGNNGQWKIWTTDGMLAGQILRHKFDPRSIVETSSAEAKKDLSLDNLTAGQEHFHGYFTQSPDGHDYIVHGHNFIALSEVIGLDQFRRLEGEIEVSTDDARRVRQRQEELARREAKSQARVLECLLVKDAQVAEVAEVDGAKFGMGFDQEFLYVRWDVTSLGQLKNSGTDFHRYFKTGACLDLQLGIDTQASAGRKSPVEGDLRLLFTMAEGKPQAVLYQPVTATPAPDEAWETRTDAGGTTRFDRVVRLTAAKLDYKTNGDSQYSFTAAIPLADLNWKPTDGQLLRCDWGVLTSDDGHTVKRRIYWSNTLATGTTDEAWEARLDPHLWGTLAVSTSSRDERQLDKAASSGKKKDRNATDDLLDEIELKKK
jgi:hypothetical protein